MPVAGRWFITPHALSRYREIVPGGTLSDLLTDSETAHPVLPQYGSRR